MLDFLKSTQVNKFLPKEKLIDKLNLSPALKESLKDDVKRFTITNELSPKSMNIDKGETVSAIFVMEVLLKQKNIDYKLVEAVAKQNTHKILFVLRYENEAQLAVFYGKLYQSDWMAYSALSLTLSGTNLDEVWDRIVRQIALVSVTSQASTVSLEDQLAIQEETEKLQKEIARLEKLARKETQPKHKFEIVGKVGELKRKLKELKR